MVLVYIYFLRLRGCLGWSNREQKSSVSPCHPCPPPTQSELQRPLPPRLMHTQDTYTHSSNAGNHTHALAYRHIHVRTHIDTHMHKLTRALECATASVSTHTLRTLSHTCTTHTLTHSHTHSHTHTLSHARKEAHVYVRTCHVHNVFSVYFCYPRCKEMYYLQAASP